MMIGKYAHRAETVLRKLTGLAEEEVYAPRPYTGLGEALLAQAPECRDLRAAQRALSRAVEREPRAAEAMLLLAQVWQAPRRPSSPGAAATAKPSSRAHAGYSARRKKSRMKTLSRGVFRARKAPARDVARGGGSWVVDLELARGGASYARPRPEYARLKS